MIKIILILLSIFCLSALLCRLYISYAHKKNWLDIPNHQTSHQEITPRGGGIVFITVWFLSAIIVQASFSFQWFWALLLPAFLIMLIGFWDDCYSVSIKNRAIFYALIAMLGVYFLGGFPHVSLSNNFIIPLPWIGSYVGVLAVMWSTNLFNFMDGIDGLAAIEALFVLGMGAILLFLSGAQELSLLALMLVAAVGGFLIWNKPVAKLFMGDAGSVSLGFAIMLFAMIGDQHYHLPFLLWMLLYILFVFDATITLIRRILAGEKWYQGHRLHAYQRLHRAGWSQKKIIMAVILLNFLFSGFALLGFFYQNLIIILLLLSIFLLIILYRKIEYLCPMYPQLSASRVD